MELQINPHKKNQKKLENLYTCVISVINIVKKIHINLRKIAFECGKFRQWFHLDCVTKTLLRMFLKQILAGFVTFVINYWKYCKLIDWFMYEKKIKCLFRCAISAHAKIIWWVNPTPQRFSKYAQLSFSNNSFANFMLSWLSICRNSLCKQCDSALNISSISLETC